MHVVVLATLSYISNDTYDTQSALVCVHLATAPQNGIKHRVSFPNIVRVVLIRSLVLLSLLSSLLIWFLLILCADKKSVVVVVVAIVALICGCRRHWLSLSWLSMLSSSMSLLLLPYCRCWWFCRSCRCCHCCYCRRCRCLLLVLSLVRWAFCCCCRCFRDDVAWSCRHGTWTRSVPCVASAPILLCKITAWLQSADEVCMVSLLLPLLVLLSSPFADVTLLLGSICCCWATNDHVVAPLYFFPLLQTMSCRWD